MSDANHPITRGAQERASRLRFPKLFALFLLLFVLDLVLPDVIPFIDEILLGMLTLLFAMLKQKVRGTPPADGDPPA